MSQNISSTMRTGDQKAVIQQAALRFLPGSRSFSRRGLLELVEFLNSRFAEWSVFVIGGEESIDQEESEVYFDFGALEGTAKLSRVLGSKGEESWTVSRVEWEQ